MAEFQRISQAPHPIYVLRAPMEPGLIPNFGTFFLEEFDRCYGHTPWQDAAPAGHMRVVRDDSSSSRTIYDDRRASSVTNSDEVSAEYYDRYFCALKAIGGRRPTLSYDRALRDVDHQDVSRETIRQVLHDRFPGLQLSLAIEGEWGKTSNKRLQGEETLELLLQYGFLPPRCAADLLDRGTKNLPMTAHLASVVDRVIKAVLDEGVAPRLKQAWEIRNLDHSAEANPSRNPNRARIAARENRRRLSAKDEVGAFEVRDRSEIAALIKNRVERKWPAGFFDKGPRVALADQLSDQAFRRAYDDFHYWSRVPRYEALHIDASDAIAVKIDELRLRREASLHAKAVKNIEEGRSPWHA